MKTLMLKGLALGLFVAMSASHVYAQTGDSISPQEEAELRKPGMGNEAGYGIGSVFANIFYMPAKVTYAGLGLVTGGLGYVLSGGNTEVANRIIYPAVGGHYVVTPNHLKGTEPIYFVGAPPPEPEESIHSFDVPERVTR
jgi:hypothetical protein